MKAKKKEQDPKPTSVENKKLRTIKGTVVSAKMDKTILVMVNRLVQHPKYLKRYLVSKKYKVHDPKNQYKEGDEVRFISSRPISKDKKWKVVYGKC